MSTVLDSTFYGNVQAALRQGIAAVPGCPVNDGSHWAFENVKMDQAPTDPWVRFTFRPQPNRVASIGFPNALIRHLGGAIVDYYVQENTGTLLADTFASAVVTALRPGTYLTYNGLLVIIRTCFASQGQVDSPYYFRSITIGWTADTTTT